MGRRIIQEVITSLQNACKYLRGEIMIKLDYLGDWIKVDFVRKGKTGDSIKWIIKSISGFFYNPKTNNWGIPAYKRQEFLEKCSRFVVEDPLDPDIGRDWRVPDTPPADYEFKLAPLPHQIIGFNVLINYSGVLLGDKMGLGKTLQLLTAMEYKHQQGKIKKVLILTKATLTYNWKAEAAKCTRQKLTVLAGTKTSRIKKYANIFHEDTLFYSMSYGTYLKDYPLLQELERYFDVMVLDEAHRAKNASSKIGTAIHRLPVTYKYALTATPFINKPIEAYNLLVWLGVEKRDWWSFKNRYAVYGGYNNKEILEYRNLKELRDMIQSVMLRRDTSILGLEKATEIVMVHMEDKQAKAYKQVKAMIRERFKEDNKTSANPLPLFTALRQAAISPRLLGDEYPEDSAKIDCVIEYLEDIIENGEKAILGTTYRKSLDLLLENPFIRSLNPVVVDGNVPAIAKKGEEFSERQLRANRFQTDPECKLFLGTIEACAEGLTLTAATHVLFLNEDIREELNKQFTGRAIRIGTTSLVTEYRIRTEGTIDKHIAELLDAKEDMFSMLIEGKSPDTKTIKSFVKSVLFDDDEEDED